MPSLKLPITYAAPRELLDRAKRELAAVPQDELFNSSLHTKSREKWCAGMMGLGYEKCIGPCRVAVNDSDQRQDADLFLDVGGSEFPFQLAEVMEPGRRRGAEYKALAAGDRKGFAYEPDRGRLEGPRWIAAGIEQKKQKHYAGAAELNLLVYANFAAYQLQHAEVVTAARPYLDAFASVWVVTNLWLGSLSVSNALGRIDGWGVIFRPEDYITDEAG